MDRIELSTWSRREKFEFFSKVSNPFFGVTFTQDVTGAYDFAKSRGVSFYYAMVYCVTHAVNSVPELLCGIENGEVVRYDRRSPSFTDMKKGDDDFYIVTMPCEGSAEEFCAGARLKSRSQTAFITPSAGSRDLIYISSVPWFEATSMTSERDLDIDDAIPRISWGKYKEEAGHKTVGISIELNHRFADGIHVAKFADALTRQIEELNRTS